MTVILVKNTSCGGVGSYTVVLTKGSYLVP